MDGPGDYYTKGSKLDKERQLLYGITYMWHLIKMKQMNFFFFFYKKEPNLQTSKSNLWLPKGKHRGKR